MKIACFAKYSFDPANLVLDRAKGKIDFERSPKKISEADVVAVEEAVRIKSTTASTVHIFMVGPNEAQKFLRELVGMGADKAYLISDQSYFSKDAYNVATILREALKKFGPYDLILAGHASEDNYAGAVALMVAELLGMPHFAYVSKLSVAQDSVTAQQSMDGKITFVRGKFPILLTVVRELNTPRYVTTLQLLRVPRDSVVTLKLEDLGVKPETQLQERIALTPLSTSRKNVIIDGTDPVAASKQLISFLRSEQVI